MVESPPSLGATLFDSLQDGLVTAAEIGGNRLLALDEEALRRCGELQGHSIAIDITDLDFQLYCHPGSWGLRLAREAPAREVDATIRGRLAALVELAVQDDKLSTSIRERVSFHGDVGLAQRLQAILADLDLDWEEALAGRVGDVAAFQLQQRARRLGEGLRRGAEALLQTSSEYLREEARLSPTRPEFEQFRTRLTALKHDVARADARLRQLLERLESR